MFNTNNFKLLFLFLFISMVAVSCDDGVEGCTDVEAYNYNSDATINDNTCLYCLDLDNQTECEASDDCEWHADHSECEEADHDDHVHCEDLTQTECETTDDCEWHADHSECEEADHDHDDDEDVHTDAEGFVLESDGNEIYRQFQGAVEGNLNLTVNQMLELSVHFLDDDENEIEYHGDDEDGLDFEIVDMNVISIELEEHDDHDHGDHGLGFELTGLSSGTTTFTLSLMHNGHSDFMSLPITVTVE